jgi:hypothetical protein
MGSTEFFKKCKLTGVTLAQSNTGHPSFFKKCKPVLGPKRPNTGHLNGLEKIFKAPKRRKIKKRIEMVQIHEK